MEDIKISSGSMINILFNSVSFKNCNFKNIVCIGESDNSSLIRFQSCDYGNTLNIKDVTINKCFSNGDLITIEGNNSSIIMSNLIINNVSSYGSIINDLSLKVCLIIYLLSLFNQ